VAGHGTVAEDVERGRGVAQWALISSVAGWAMASRSRGGQVCLGVYSARLILVAQSAWVCGTALRQAFCECRSGQVVGRSLPGPTPVAADRFALRARGG
jgi:hypothetical protein